MEERLINNIIDTAIEEDLAWGDLTSETLIPPEIKCELLVVLKEEGVIAGIHIAEKVFKIIDPDIKWEPLQKDGQYLPKMTPVIKVSGSALSILKAERIALNFMQRLSGIATQTHKFVKAANQVSDKVRITDTRKTTPGLRYLERYAVRVGGGFNHRNNLSESILIKDNHLSILKQQGKSVKETIHALRQAISHTIQIEIEVDNLQLLKDVLETNVDTIMLDNMNCEDMVKAVKMINGDAIVEASGGVCLDMIAKIAATGVDIVSVGALTHSAPSLDIGLEYL
ncbi:MAG: carboxylating nicotinate-nucleotide diphosphorylase [Deltaproteobacteria bacterium]|nr:carboxylating nicotinate-nucleotide diphosphorylase [Deltaproteobacteria bacterium]